MIEVVFSAPFNTVQDLGRLLMRVYGVARGGAMDALALRLGNIMLGNDENAAGLEVQMAPVHLRFHADTVIALTGADFSAELDGVPLPVWWSVPVRKGQMLKLVRPRVGARAVLCVSGGLDVPPVLESRSTMLVEELGGYEGRCIVAGDHLSVVADTRPCSRSSFGIVPPGEALAIPGTPQETVLRYIRSDEREMFDALSLARFEEEPWTVSALSNRMGFRLEGLPLVRREQVEMRSHGIMEGVIQVPPSGLPVVQLADGNSAGGYPKLGVICRADLWRFVQCPPGSRVRFQAIPVAEAARAYEDIENYVAGVRRVLPLAPSAAGEKS